ncbi:hypothetical protein [Streptomyces longispororuber]|uniref:hypothetical protein n=1 Tax=Streptomyces longispororuber TaxID=68230 RepID=UPI002108B667|nr:hypothetical protein [Streptomyces longispororuber]MCQ4209245.1 hypothetical protein [Streptomyces longispororuber]
MVTINVALLLGVIAILLLRRPVVARKRGDTLMVMIILLVIGVLIAPTALGEAITNGMSQLATNISQWAS